MKMLIRIIAMVMLTFLMLSLTKCTPDKDRVADADNGSEIKLDSEREELRRDLKKLGNDLDKRIDQITKKLENATDESRDRLEDAYRRLSDERSRVEEIAEEVEASGAETWNEIRLEAQNTSEQARSVFIEVGNEISDFFDNKER